MSTIEHLVPPDELLAYFDGELPPDRAAIVRTHISACAECQALAADLQRTTEALREWDVEPPPDSLRAPALPSVRSRGWPTPFASWPAGLRHAAAAAFCIVAAGAVMWLAEFRPRYAVSAPNAPPTTDEAMTIARGGGGAGGAGGGRVAERAALASPPPAASSPALSAQAARLEERALQSPNQAANVEPVAGRKIVRTVHLTLVTKDVGAVRPAIEALLRDVGGFVGSIQASGEADAGSLHATLRVPVPRLDAAVTSLRALGRVTGETQTGEEVGEQVRDLEARLTNSRNTEKRLTDVLRTRTGDVSDVLQVEREIARVREEIERLDGQRIALERRVAYATITLSVERERQATLDIGPLPLTARLRNAAVDGLRRAFASVVAVTLAALHVAPVVLIWAVVLWWPVRLVIRRSRLSAEKPA